MSDTPVPSLDVIAGLLAMRKWESLSVKRKAEHIKKMTTAASKARTKAAKERRRLVKSR